MPWHEITLDVPEPLKDAAIGELTELGAAGVWESGESQLTAYFAQPPNLLSLQLLFERAELPWPEIKLAPVADRDWGEEWKKSWSSFPMGSRFFVIPSWLDSLCPPGRLPLHIDPGQAFGTGTHESTQLTLEALERWLQPDHVVLDLGTGSGILAIAAVKLGARSVVAFDNDPVAVEVAHENTERNNTTGIGLMCSSIDAVATHSADLILCNVTADVIASIYSDIHRVLRPNGLAIFSGILNFQVPAVLQVASAHAHATLALASRGEWSALVTRKMNGD
jgi:ribosomal protein L11 methyltransferase